MRALVFVIALIVAACGAVSPGPSDVPVPTNEAEAVCKHLGDIACSEGWDPNCAKVFNHVQSTGLTDLHPDCLLAAKSREEARACKSVSCP